MDEVLTMAEIEARYAPDWVLIDEPQTDEDLTALRGGKVLFHSPNRDEVWDKATELGLKRCAVWYLGTYPENLVLIL